MENKTSGCQQHKAAATAGVCQDTAGKYDEPNEPKCAKNRAIEHQRESCYGVVPQGSHPWLSSSNLDLIIPIEATDLGSQQPH